MYPSKLRGTFITRAPTSRCATVPLSYLHLTHQSYQKSPEFTSVINDAVAFINSTTLFNSPDPIPIFQSQILGALNASAETLVPSQYTEVIEGYKTVYQTLVNDFLPDIAQIEMLMNVMSAGTVTIQAALQHPFSAGRAYITSTNPFDPIIIDPQYYSHFAGTFCVPFRLTLGHSDSCFSHQTW